MRLHQTTPAIVLGVLAVALTGAFSGANLRAGEPAFATVALLVPVDTDVDALRCIVFDGAGSDSIDDGLVVESNSALEPFSGASLYASDGMLIGKGGDQGSVHGVDAPVPEHGVMILGSKSGSAVELAEFVYLDGSTVRYEPNPEFATYLLLIVTGPVR